MEGYLSPFWNSDTIRYDTLEDVDSKADCVQFNLAHVARKKLKGRNIVSRKKSSLVGQHERL